MGMSGAYGGSGGAEFSRVREDAQAFTSQPSQEAARRLLRNLLTAIDGQPQSDGVQETGESAQNRPHGSEMVAVPPVALPRVIAVRGARGAGAGDGQGPGGGGGRRSSGRSRGGGGGGGTGGS